MQPLGPVDLDVEQRVEEVEARRPTSRPRAPSVHACQGRSPRIATHAAHRREPVDGAEPQVREPGDALEVRVDDEADHRDRPQPAADRVELPDRDEEDRERRRRRRAVT